MSAPKVFIFNRQKDVSFSLPSVRRVVKEFLFLAKIETDEVSVFFVSSTKIAKLHHEFFGDDSITDCISCPMDEDDGKGYHILGDIFICPKAAKEFLAKKKIYSEKEICRELTLYLIHGLLHLCGYDDIEKKDRAKMRTLEKKYMSLLTSFISRKKVFNRQ